MIFKGFIRSSDQKLTNWYLEFPADTHERMGLPRNSRVLIEFNGMIMHRALRSSSNGYDYIGLTGAFLKKHKLVEDQSIEVSLKEDISEFGMDFPEEMQEVMAQDEEGSAMFYALNPGLQRGFLHYASSAKGVQTRINRALHIMNRLRELASEGKIKGFEP